MTLTRVGHLDTLIRVPTERSSLASLLDEVARDRLPAALGVSVSRALPTSGEVLVLRRVDVDLELKAGAPTGPEEVAARWAAAAGTAAAAVAGSGDDRDVVRFADEACFIASFVGDLLAGRAWEMWCYGAFAELRDLPVGAAIARVLADHGGHLSDILVSLGRAGTLERVLTTLSTEEAKRAWAAARGPSPQPLDGASALPIAAAALAVARGMRLSRHAPEPAELAASHHRWAPHPVDWSDRGALADVVYAAFAEIVRLTSATSATEWRQGSESLGPAGWLGDSTTAAVRELDWLDRERLVARIVALLDPAARKPDIRAPDGGMAELRQTLAWLARESGLHLLDGSHDRSVIALRVLAALATRDPELAARPDMAAEIERLLPELAIRSRAIVEATHSRRGDPCGSREASTAWRRCDAAGVLLLTRALADTRLAGLASRLELPDPGVTGDSSAALLLSVGLAVAGSAGVREDGQLDPALPALLAREDSVTAAMVAAAWSSTDAAQHRALRDELVAFASGQRLGRPAPAAVCRHPSIPGLARGTVARAAHLALMAWARWLPGLADSSPGFLLRQLLRRGGSVSIASDAVRVVLDPRPLDVVVELAGYLEPLERVPWLSQRGLQIERGDG